MLALKNISLYRDTTCLLKNVNLTIKSGAKIGLIGENGSGKSSLFAAIQGLLDLVQGELEYPKAWRISYLKQELPHSEESALDYVLNSYHRYREIQAQIKIAELHDDANAIAHWYQEFQEIDGYRAQAEAEKILRGLNFSEDELRQPVTAFSGGWQMRLNLAQILINPAELLLLDEPTNHLDLDAIIWFEKWLQKWHGTLLLISHDRDFLDNIVDGIAHLYQQNIKFFSGNYTAFEKQWAQQLILEQKLFAKQQAKRSHLEEFVAKFRYKASKAKQAQSRIKMLEKMQEVAITKLNSPFTFQFEENENCPNPIMTIEQVDLGYDENIILQQINCQINAEQRIALVGPNGAGKSTLVKYLANQKLALKGNKQIHPHCQIGYFAQHQLEQLEADKTPLAFFKQSFPTLEERHLRSYLGGFGFSQEKAMTKIDLLSGGEKSRLVLALLVKQNPNFLLLDEPTNHLDLMMREALIQALQLYSGSLLLISHDRYLIRAVCDELWLVADGKVQPFPGDINHYFEWLTDYRESKQFLKKKSGKENNQIQQLRNQLLKLESEIAKNHEALIANQQTLGDTHLYETTMNDQLQALLERGKQLQLGQQRLEQEWYLLIQRLEAIS